MDNPCENCLLKQAQEVSYNQGYKNFDAEVVICGESPEKSELREGKMFVGPSGKMLNKELERIGLERSKVFLINAARCLIPKQDLSAGQINSILSCCRPNVEKAMHTIKPKLCVCLGSLATQQIYKKMTMKNARNQVFWSDEFNCYVISTYHPAYCLRSLQAYPYFQSDFDQIKRFIDNGYKENENIKWKEVETIRPILDGDCYKENGSLLVGIDTETQGTQWSDPNSITLSYQLSKNLYEGWTVILHEEVEKDAGDFNIVVQRGGTKSKPKYEEVGIRKAFNYEKKIEELAELCRRKDIKKYFANIKYEKHRFQNLGITEFNSFIFDVFVGAHVLDSENFKHSSLDALISFFGASGSHKSIVADGEKADMLSLLTNDRDRFVKYASLDPCQTLQVALEIRERLKKDPKSLNYFVNFAMPAERDLLYEIERNGVNIDLEKLPEVKSQILDEMQEAVEKIKKLIPNPVLEKHKDNFKLTRNIILKEALFEWTDTKLNKNQTEPEHHNYGFNIKPPVLSKKTGEPSTDKKESLKAILEGKYPRKAKELVETYIYYSELNKLLTNYIKNIEFYTTEQGTLHASFSITGTSSGRVSARNPNLMNQPKRGKLAKYIRQLFVASEGRKLCEGDFKASEIKFVAQVSRDKNLIKVLNEGKDIHLATGLAMKGLPYDHEFESVQEKKDLRQASKAQNFGCLYKISAPGFARHADQGYGVKMTVSQAQEAINKFFSIYPGIPQWHKESEALLKKQGYLRSLFGRIRYGHNIRSNDEAVVEAETRTLLNFEIQSISSDNAILAGINILNDPNIDTDNDCKIVLFLHDALFFSIKTDKLYEILPKIKQHMEHTNVDELFGVKMVVPMEVELEIGKNLANMEEVAV